MSNLIERIEKINPLFVVIPLTLFGLFVRIKWRYNKDLWTDEIYQIGPMNLGFWEFFEQLPRHDFAGYINLDHFIIYFFYQIFGDNKMGLAVPHLGFTIVSFVLLFLICKSIFRSIWGTLITFSIFAFNHNLVIHSLEIRPYSGLIVIGLMIFYLLYKLMEKKFVMTNKERWGIGFLFLLSILFHVYGVTILFYITLFYLLLHCRDESFTAILKNMIPFYLIVGLIAFPVWYDSIFGEHAKLVMSPQVVFAYIPNPFEDLIGFLKGIFCNLIGYKKFYILFGGLILSFLLPHGNRNKQIGFFLILVLLPITVILITDLQKHYSFIQRQFIWIMPLFAVLLGWAWESVYYFWKDKLN